MKAALAWVMKWYMVNDLIGFLVLGFLLCLLAMVVVSAVIYLYEEHRRKSLTPSASRKEVRELAMRVGRTAALWVGIIYLAGYGGFKIIVWLR